MGSKHCEGASIRIFFTVLSYQNTALTNVIPLTISHSFSMMVLKYIRINLVSFRTFIIHLFLNEEFLIAVFWCSSKLSIYYRDISGIYKVKNTNASLEMFRSHCTLPPPHCYRLAAGGGFSSLHPIPLLRWLNAKLSPVTT